MKIRFLAALLLAALVFTVFSGCAAADALAHTASLPEMRIVEDPAPLASTPQATQPQPITREQAISIALEHAKLTEDQVSRLRAESGYDDGRPEYEVEFFYGGWEYDYEIDAATGAITQSQCELELPKATEPAATQPQKADAPAVAAPQAESATLTREEARDIALKHAGLSVNDVTRLKAEFDRDDGRTEYDVEFHHGGYEYDYEIDAVTGSIRTWDKDRDD